MASSGAPEVYTIPASLVVPVVSIKLQTWWQVMNEERTGKCLRQVKHTHGHLWHKYSITVNQVMVVTVQLSKWWHFNLTNRNPSFSSVVVSSNPLSRTYWYEPQALQQRDIYSICRCCWNVATYKWKVHDGKIEIISSFSRKVASLTAPHCRFWGVGQGMKQRYLYLWYPLFQAQWEICYQRNH